MGIDTGSFADGIFPHGQKAELGLSLENRTTVDAKLKIDWRLTTDEKQAVASHAQEKVLRAGEKTRVTFERKLPKPGFYWVAVTCSWKDGKASSSMQVGYAPEKLRPPLTAQPDFRDFWDSSLAELAKVPPRFKMTPQEGNENGEVDV